MASLIIIAMVVTVAGVVFGAYLGICFAICREDRRKWSLRSGRPTSSTRPRALSSASTAPGGTSRGASLRLPAVRRGPAGGTGS